MTGSKKNYFSYSFLDKFIEYQHTLIKSINDVYSIKYGLKLDEWRILTNLYSFSTLSAKEISQKAHIRPVRVSRAMVSLENKNYITRHVNIVDRRSVLSCLTQKGRNIIMELSPVIKQNEKKILLNLTKDEQAMLVKLMAKICKNRGGGD
jgi:DNA-binding MarR family transcriptional regulator